MSLSQLYENEKTVALLSGVFDYAVNYCNTPGDVFWDYFILSGISKQFENKTPKYVLGKDAAEIVYVVFERVNLTQSEFPDYIAFDRSPEYWGGWVIANYQLHSGSSYKKIHDIVSFGDLVNFYDPYHEAPAEKIIDLLERRQETGASNLKIQRELAGLSQSELARYTATSVKTIQAYEQKLKNISHAKAETVRKFSHILSCEAEDLI